MLFFTLAREKGVVAGYISQASSSETRPLLLQRFAGGSPVGLFGVTKVTSVVDLSRKGEEESRPQRGI